MKKFVSFVLALLLFMMFAAPAAAKHSPPSPIDLLVRARDIILDPPVLNKGQTVTVSATIHLSGTKADLQAILDDLGVPGVPVRIEADPGLGPIDLVVPANSFNQDFGQAVISTPWDIPANTTLKRATIKVTIDLDNQLIENKEGNNTASHHRHLHAATPDTVAPGIAERAGVTVLTTAPRPLASTHAGSLNSLELRHFRAGYVRSSRRTSSSWQGGQDIQC